MTLRERCDEILDLIDGVLADPPALPPVPMCDGGPPRRDRRRSAAGPR